MIDFVRTNELSIGDVVIVYDDGDGPDVVWADPVNVSRERCSFYTIVEVFSTGRHSHNMLVTRVLTAEFGVADLCSSILHSRFKFIKLKT